LSRGSWVLTEIYFFKSFEYQWNTAKIAALQRSAMSIENVMPHSCTPAECYVSEITCRSAGADISVHKVAINILLRLNKEGSIMSVMC